MLATQFLLGVVRLGAITLPALLAARWWRRAFLAISGPLAALVDAVLTLSLLVIGAELLGLIAAMRPLPLTGLFVALAAGSWALSGRALAVRSLLRGQGAAAAWSGSPARLSSGWVAGLGARADRVAGLGWPVLAGLAVVIAQWCEGTANVLGGGMLSFDSLWYHMPFAARFAQTGSVTAIQFTQADPYVAYYPANSELLHAVGIAALHGDVLSPFLNLLWAAIFLLACWDVGERWRAQRHTLLAGCLVLGLPVLSTTQPGQGFSDIAGLAMLLAGVALVVRAGEQPALLAVAGLALGFALGTKVTFLIPALVVAFGVPLLAPVGERVRALLLMAVPLALAGGWWYLRDAVNGGNPLGLRLQIGPLVLAGPRSFLADEQQGTVIANLQHLSLWSSRFVPGLAHALGILWPLVLAATLFGCVAGLSLLRDPLARLIALTGAVAGVIYFILPTSASGIAQGTTLFEVNLRYVTPAIALGTLLVPIVVAHRWPRQLLPVGLGLLTILVAAQFERSVWPAQPARHAAFLLAATALLLLPLASRRLAASHSARAATTRVRQSAPAAARPSPAGRPPRAAREGPLALRLVLAWGAVAAIVAGGAFVIQRHYYGRRYLTGAGAVGAGQNAGGPLFAWAQHISHARIALYGPLTQYPLYGAADNNHVDYLGRHTGDGGFLPIADCRLWRSTVNAGHYDYVVLGPSQTGEVPVAWTAADPAARPVLEPGPDQYVFRLTGPMQPATCPAG